MTRRLFVPLLLVVLALSACGRHASAAPQAGASCSPPAGGQCASDVAWSGPLLVSADGLRLYGRVACGGTLSVAETADTVTITLHVPALGPGMRSCALVDVGARLAAPLDGRTVLDGVSGHEVKVLSQGRLQNPGAE